LRSYREIRPYTGYCLERIVRVDFAAAMAIAIQDAKQSRREGNKGYGAVILLGTELLCAAHDTAATENDPSRHAEVNAVRLAAARLGEADLSGAVLLSTCEPCPMCSSLAVWANVTTLVYGVSIEETAQMGKARIHVSAQEIVDRSPAMLEVIGGVMAGECRILYE
jgi:tRNA(adenine34) deaminase